MESGMMPADQKHLDSSGWFLAALCLLITAPAIICFMWTNSIPAAPGRVALTPIYTGLKWLKFHSVNLPHPPSEPHVVLIGSSNVAGHGNDYRMLTRDRIDLWNRQSFPFFLEERLRAGGTRARVSNLALNGCGLRSELFLYLYALEQKPDLIIFALSEGSFAGDGNFRNPKNLQCMNDGLLALLARCQYPDKARIETELLEYMSRQPRVAWRENLQPTRWDAIIAFVARSLQGAYLRIGLPEFVAAPSPKDLETFVEGMLAEREMTDPVAQASRQMADTREMASLFPSILPILKNTADRAGVRLVVLLPPSGSSFSRWFLGQRRREAESCGIETIDLIHMRLEMDRNTFDGRHLTGKGGMEMADACWMELRRKRLVQ